MIDRDRDQPSITRPSPVGGEVQQGQGVAPAGQGDRDRRVGRTVQSRVQPGPDPFPQVGGFARGQEQRASVPVRVATVFS